MPDLAPPPLWLPPKPAIIRSALDIEPPKIVVPGDEGFDLSFMPGVAPVQVAEGATPFDAAFVAYAQQTPGSTTITQAIDIGAADPTKVAVIVMGSTTNTTIAAASIDGETAVVLQSSGNNAFGAIIYAPVPTGGTVNVVVSTPLATVSAAAFGSYRLVGTGLSPTPSSTSNPAGGGDSTRTATLTNTTGGVSIVAGRVNNNSAISISNVDTMNVDTVFAGSDGRLKAGIDYPTASGSLGYALSTSRCIVGAHWAAP